MVTADEFTDKEGRYHKITVDDKNKLAAKTVIISTGATAKYLGLPSEQRLRGGGVSACAVCDGFFYTGQEVAIVGAGDTAADRKSTRLNSSHVRISYAVFCLKKKKEKIKDHISSQVA